MASTHSFEYFGTLSVSGQLSAPTATLTGMTPGYAVYNNGSGVLASEQFLAVSRGGMGGMSAPANLWSTTHGNVDPGGSLVAVDAVLPAILGANVGVFDRLAVSTSNVPGSLVMRGSDGSISNSVYSLTSNTPLTTVTMSNAVNTVTALVQCHAVTTAGSAHLFALNAAAYGSNAAALVKCSAALMRSSGGGANTDTGTFEISARATYATGAPGTWTVSPLTFSSSNLSTPVNASTMTVTSVGDVLYVDVANAAVSSIDWSGLVQITYEKQLV